MSDRKAMLLALFLLTLAVPSPALAYIDPGTTSSLFAFLAPLVALLGVFLGYLLWPFRKLFLRLFRKPKDDAADDAEKPEEA